MEGWLEKHTGITSGGISAAAALLGLFVAWRTVVAAVRAFQYQLDAKELEKRERYFDRFVVVRMTDALDAFTSHSATLLKDAVDQITAAATTTGVPPKSVDGLIQNFTDQYFENVAELRKKVRFAEAAFGPGTGALWPTIDGHLDALEDDVQNMIAELAIPSRRSDGLIDAMRVRAAAVLSACYVYDMDSHRKQPTTAKSLPRRLAGVPGVVWKQVKGAELAEPPAVLRLKE